MINLTLLKKEIRSSWKIFLVCALALLMYVIMVISMFDPDLGSILAEFEEALPGIMAAFGMTGAGQTSLTGYISSYLFGFVMLIFPIIYSIIITNRIAARYVDNGAMAYLLASPHPRSKIIRTQALFTILSTFFMLLIVTIIGALFCQVMFPGELDLPKYIALNTGVMGLHLAFGGIGFLASCISNELRLSYALSASIPILGYLLQMIVNQGEKYDVLKYFSLFTLFSPDQIIAGEANGFYMALCLYVIGIILFIAGCRIFKKRNFPI